MDNILTLEAVQYDFQQWRLNRKRRVAIPDELWQKVLPLLKTYPISKICSALSINTAQINSKLGTQVSSKKMNLNNDQNEMSILKSADIAEDIGGVSIEITRKDGASMSIKTYLNPAIKELINQFLRD